MTGNIERDVESQISYATMKYGGNRPPSVVRAEAEKLARDAMTKWNPSMGGVKTYLSARLQKLSRKAYKASSPLSIPEKRLMGRAKFRDFIEGYADSFGHSPSVSEIASGLKMTQAEASRMVSEYGAVRAESSFSDKKQKNIGISFEGVVESLPNHQRNMARDYFLKNMTDEQLKNKYKLKNTTYSKKKREIIFNLKNSSHFFNIDRD